MYTSLVHGFCERVATQPDRPALFVANRHISYRQLGEQAGRFSTAIQSLEEIPNPLVALLAARSEAAYAGILGILLAGKGYVPLNPKFPAERLARMYVRSQCDILIVGEEGLTVLKEMLPLVDRPMTVVVPSKQEAAGLTEKFPSQQFVGLDSLSCSKEIAPPTVDAESVAYLLFTSGSTGDPKGVAISQRSVTAYVQYVCQRYDVQPEDRVSQHFDLTFDLSVHDMFVCWQRGATLYCIPEKSLILPAKFIRDHELTMWFSVPSAIGVMQRTGVLKPGAFPSLRWSLFCGEPLSAAAAEAWQVAAPNCIIENLYGPTEATIAITHYRWDQDNSPGQCINGVVPLGTAFAGQRAAVIGTEGQPVSPGEPGELVLGGSQLALGYWNDPNKTEERFLELPQLGSGTWYRTADVAKQDSAGCLFFLGRSDHQVKIRGYRVELQEIEHAVREVDYSLEAVCVAWPVRNGSAEGVVAFVCTQDADRPTEDAILAQCRQSLPDYMVPRRVVFMSKLPQNVNGKVDRKRLLGSLEEGEL